MHSPRRPRHCTYEGAIYIAGISVTAKLIKGICKEVARKLAEGYTHGHEYEGVGFRQVIDSCSLHKENSMFFVGLSGRSGHPLTCAEGEVRPTDWQ